jgi:hypothetical protein
MLGDILNGLTNPDTAEAMLAVVGNPSIRDRIDAAAAAQGTTVGELVATKIRHLVDHGSEEIWLDLFGVMANAPQPAAAAIERLLASAFPDPARVRVTHNGHAHP